MVEFKAHLKSVITALLHALDKDYTLSAAFLAARAARLDPSRPQWQALHGEMLRRIGRLAEAEAVLSQVGVTDPEQRINATVSLARIFEATGRLSDAEEAYRAATELAPEDTSVRNFYAAHLATRGRIVEAISILTDGLDAVGDKDELLLNLGHCERAIGRYDLARKWYKRALRLSPGYKLAKIALADLSLAAASGIEAAQKPLPGKA